MTPELESLAAQPSDAATLLGFRPMDDTHAEFAQRVQDALNGPDLGFPARLDALVQHLQAHFAQEDRWMEDSGFPPRECHQQEHAAVLRSATEVQALAEPARTRIGRDFVREVDAWFGPHATHLDSALAAWMCKRALGGKPVVLQPRPGQGARP